MRLIATLVLFLSLCGFAGANDSMPMTDEALDNVNSAFSDPGLKRKLERSKDASGEESLKILVSTFELAFNRSGYDLETTFFRVNKDLVEGLSADQEKYMESVSIEAVTLVVRVASTIVDLSKKSGVNLNEYFGVDASNAVQNLAQFY